MLRSILNTDIRSWAFGVSWWFLLVLPSYAYWFVRCRDIGPPRTRIGPGTYVLLAVMASWCHAWAVVLIGLVLLAASILLGFSAFRRDWASQRYLNRDSGDRTVLIVPDLSRRLAGEAPLLLPQVCLDRLTDAEVDALLARQAAPRSFWPMVASAIPLAAVIFGVRAVPPSLLPLIAVVGMLCQWALTVWASRRLDAQADAKAIQTTGDPATYIQALVKADRLMQEIPRRHRMSIWWLFPVSLEVRIAAITPHIPEVPHS